MYEKKGERLSRKIVRKPIKPRPREIYDFEALKEQQEQKKIIQRVRRDTYVS